MRILGQFLFFFVLATALAPLPSLAAPGFFQPEHFPIGFIEQSVARDAFAKTMKTNLANGACAFTPIGQDVVLTALHCLRATSLFRSEALPDRSGAIVKIVRHRDTKLVLASGTSYPELFESMIEPNDWSLDDRLKYKSSFQEDWAILSVPTNDHKCFAPASLPERGKAHDYFLVGFPARAFRGPNSTIGGKKALSVGHISNNLSQNPYIQSLAPKTRSFLSAMLAPLFDIGRLALLDVDARPGNSGGPALTQDGKLLGITIAGFVTAGAGNMYEYFPSSAVILPIETIKNSLRAKGYDPKRFFQCTE